MAERQSVFAGPKRGIARHRPVAEASTVAETGGERGSGWAGPAVIHPSLLADPRLVAGMGQIQRIHLVQGLQRTHGNGYVARVIGQSRLGQPHRPANRDRYQSTSTAEADGSDTFTSRKALVGQGERRRDPLHQPGGGQTSPSVQRAPRATAHRAPAHYADFLSGIMDLTEAANPRDPERMKKVGAVQFGNQLSPEQRGLLLSLQIALIDAYTDAPGSPQAGLQLWEAIARDLSSGVQQAKGKVEPPETVTDVLKDLSWLDKYIIRPEAYDDAHQRALAESDLQTPDLVFQQQRLNEASEGFKEIQEKLEKKVVTLTGGKILDKVLGEAGMGKEIFELVQSPHELGEAFEQLKKKGLLRGTATAADLVNKAVAFVNTFAKIGLDTIKGYAEKKIEIAAARKAAEEVEHWEKVAKGLGEKLKVVSKIAKVVEVVGVVVSVVKIFDAIARGDWEAADVEAGTTALGGGATALLTGAAGSAMVGGFIFLVEAELHAMHMAAEFIRWCKDETVRDAAKSFIDVCSKVSQYPAQDLVADVKAYFDPANASIQDLIETHIQVRVGDMRKGLAAIGEEVLCTQPQCLGGHGDLVNALGDEAVRVLRAPFAYPDDPLTLADVIHSVFAGANNMAKYVHEHYPTDAEKAAKEGPKKSED